MAIEIHSNNLGQSRPELVAGKNATRVVATGGYPPRKMPPAEPRSGGPGSDHVEVTATGSLLLQLSRAIDSLPNADLRRIDELRSALRHGRYAPDPTRVAEKLLRFEQML